MSMKVDTQIEVTTLGNLADKTMFLTLEFNRFGNSRKADVEVANTTAQQNRFSHSKQLLDSPELKAIAKADAALRVWIDTQPACWKHGKSTRVVGYDSVAVILEACKNYEKVTRPALVEKFVEVYLQRIAEAQKALGDKFNGNDYPSVDAVRQEFSFDWNLLSFSTPEKLKTISPEFFAKEQEKLQLAVDEWKQGRRAILQEMVTHLLGVLNPEEGKKKRLHAVAVTKLQDFLKTFDLNSVPDDAELHAEVVKLKALMAGVDVDKIKESDNLKADLVKQFTEVSASVSTLVTSSGRKFR